MAKSRVDTKESGIRGIVEIRVRGVRGGRGGGAVDVCFTAF